MPKVKLQDGRVVEMSLEEIEARNAALNQPQGGIRDLLNPQANAGAAAADSFVRNSADMILNIPGAAGDMLAGAAGGLRALAGGGQPGPGEEGDGFLSRAQRAFQDERGKGVAGGLNALQSHIPDSTDILAMARPGDTAQNREQILDQRLQMQEQFPVATTVGDFGADAFALMSGRAPRVRLFTRKEFTHPPLPPSNMAISTRTTYDDIVQSTFAKMLKRGTKRAAETGFEAATLAALNEGDPISTGAYAAGTQAAGSAALSMLMHKKGRWGLIGAGALGAGFLQLLDSAVPGGKDYILENIETSYSHVAAVMGLGLLAGMAGAGRMSTDQGMVFRRAMNSIRRGESDTVPLRASITKNFPLLADAISSIPKSVMMSTIRSATDPSNDTADAERLVIEQMGKDPNFFGPTAARRFERSMTVKDAPRLKDQIKSLMKDRRFQQKLDELQDRREVQRNAPGPQGAAPGQGERRPNERSMDPLGVAPPGAIDAAISRAEAVPQGQAMSNAENAMAQQTAVQILREVQTAPIPPQQKQAIVQAVGDPSQMTMQKLQQLQQMLGGM